MRTCDICHTPLHVEQLQPSYGRCSVCGIEYSNRFNGHPLADWTCTMRKENIPLFESYWSENHIKIPPLGMFEFRHLATDQELDSYSSWANRHLDELISRSIDDHRESLGRLS